MLEALFWGFAASLSLIFGALIAFAVPIGKRALALVLAFGAGVLISAVAFELTEDAFDASGADAVAIGLVLGAATYFGLDTLVDRHASSSRKRSHGPPPDSSARAIALGAALDGVPESAVIGLSLIDGGGVSVAIVTAVLISNMPESNAASSGFLKAGHRRGWIMGLWVAVVVVSTLSAAIGYAALAGAPEFWISLMQAFAGGALLTMLTDSMIPEAFENGGDVTGVATVVGFACAFLLSTV